MRTTNRECEYIIMAAREQLSVPHPRRWSLLLYVLAAPFEALVVLSALQVGSRSPSQIFIIQLGRTHPLPLAALALASMLMVGLGWLIDRPFRLAAPSRTMSSAPRTVLAESSASPAILTPEFEEPTMIMHAVVMEGGDQAAGA